MLFALETRVRLRHFLVLRLVVGGFEERHRGDRGGHHLVADAEHDVRAILGVCGLYVAHGDRLLQAGAERSASDLSANTQGPPRKEKEKGKKMGKTQNVRAREKINDHAHKCPVERDACAVLRRRNTRASQMYVRPGCCAFRTLC